MTPDIIGIENDQSQIIIDRVSTALLEKGVKTLAPSASDNSEIWFVGMGNKRMARIHLPSLKDLSEEQIQEKASEIIKEVEMKLMAGGDDVDV